MGETAENKEDEPQVDDPHVEESKEEADKNDDEVVHEPIDNDEEYVDLEDAAMTLCDNVDGRTEAANEEEEPQQDDAKEEEPKEEEDVAMDVVMDEDKNDDEEYVNVDLEDANKEKEESVDQPMKIMKPMEASAMKIVRDGYEL